jgi:protease-3
MRKRGWVNGIACKTMSKSVDFNLFVINMVVTESGMINALKVLESVFAYIKIIRDRGLSKDRFKEYCLISYLEFLYSDRDNIEDYLLDVIGKLHETPLQHLLLREKVTMEYDPNILKEYID